jgi:hypothetical protein
MMVLPPDKWPCGCKAVLVGSALEPLRYDLQHCPLHEAAPDLLAVSEQLIRILEGDDKMIEGRFCGVYASARQAIANATRERAQTKGRE